MRHTIKLVALAIAILVLSSCGGGGGGGAASNPPVGGGGGGNTTGPLAPNGQKLQLVSLSLRADDVIANTAPSNQVAGIPTKMEVFALSTWASLTDAFGKVAGLVVPNVLAASTYPPAQTEAEFLASRRMVDGSLFSLDPIVKYFEIIDGVEVEREIECDLSTAEVSIENLYLLNEITQDILVLGRVPDTINEGCILSYRPATLVITGGGDTFDVTEVIPSSSLTGSVFYGATYGRSRIVPARLPGINESDTPLLILGDRGNYVVKALDVSIVDKITLTDLTLPVPQIELDMTFFAFNGQYLVSFGLFNATNKIDLLIYEKGSTAIGAYRHAESDFEQNNYEKRGWNTVILDDQGRFLVQNVYFYVFDPQAPSLVGIAPASVDLSSNTCMQRDELGTVCLQYYQADMLGVAVGRYGKWIIGNGGRVWNYETYEAWCLVGGALEMHGEVEAQQCWLLENSFPANILNSGKYVYTVSADNFKFQRFDLDSRQATLIDLGLLGYIPVDYSMYKDKALVEVVNTANSDKMYVEVNFETGEVIDRGVIEEGSRTVVSFTPISG